MPSKEAHRSVAALSLVAVTAYGSDEARARARAAGFDDHLVKPITLGALERALVSLSSAKTKPESN
jgi:CheY-like chemotaxis protein